jgi:leucyl aminopeptidase
LLRDLLPLIHERDTSSVAVTKLTSQVQKAKQELKEAEIENINIGRQNAQISAQMIALAAEANNQRKEDITDPKLRQQLDELEVEMKMSRQKWRIMKATASAAIVGSGVDWARDPDLLKIVLDDDEMDG